MSTLWKLPGAFAELAVGSVVYPGTHDNDTTLGWYATASEKERDHVRRYLRVGGEALGWDFVRAGYQSVSRLTVFPVRTCQPKYRRRADTRRAKVRGATGRSLSATR